MKEGSRDCSNKEKLIEVEYKIDQILESSKQIEIIIAKQQTILDEHIKRTEQLENQLAPIKAYYNQIIGVMKFMGFIGFSSIVSLLGYFLKNK